MKQYKYQVKRRRSKLNSFLRKNRYTILFNTPESNAIDQFCSRFKIKNKSKFMREAIITEVLRKFDSHYPTLFEEDQPTLF